MGFLCGFLMDIHVTAILGIKVNWCPIQILRDRVNNPLGGLIRQLFLFSKVSISVGDPWRLVCVHRLQNSFKSIFNIIECLLNYWANIPIVQLPDGKTERWFCKCLYIRSLIEGLQTYFFKKEHVVS